MKNKLQIKVRFSVSKQKTDEKEGKSYDTQAKPPNREKKNRTH